MTPEQKKKFSDWLTNNLQFTSKSNIELIVRHVEHYFCPASASPGTGSDAATLVLEAVRSLYPISERTPEVSHLIGEVEKFVYNLRANPSNKGMEEQDEMYQRLITDVRDGLVAGSIEPLLDKLKQQYSITRL